MNHKLWAEYKNVRLRPLEKDDIESLRIWRNEPKNTEYLTKIPYITQEKQLKWYEEYIQDQDYLVFAIDEIKEYHRMVGSIALYNIRDTSCEYGRFMIGDPEVKGKKVGLNSLLLCIHIAFKELCVQKCVASVHEENAAARKTDERAGFLICGRHPFFGGGDELEIELSKERFYSIHQDMKNIDVRTDNGVNYSD